MRIKSIAAIVFVALAFAAVVIHSVFFSVCAKEKTMIYIYENETPETVKASLEEQGIRTKGFSLLCRMLDYKVRPGLYVVNKEDNMLTMFRRLRNGQQEPVNLTIPPVRTMERMAQFLGEKLMMDSTLIIDAFKDSCFCSSHGYSVETLPALFIPNTYQVYWTISLDDFMKRMVRENKAFWNDEREKKAKAIGMSHEEVMTLASIIDEETANNGEKPMIAGMYIKRLQIGMPLQADPTVKFALGDFSLRRIWGRHLTVDSQYNTYKNTGLPPGPIRVPSVAGIDAVLNYTPHDCIYMCAKEDFSGTHNFARTYAEHMQNAKRYAKALNERGIR